MSIDTDLRTELMAASTTFGGRVHQNTIPQLQAKNYPRCWFQRSATDDHLNLDGSRGGLVVYQYDAECISDTLASAITAADAIRTTLNGKRGTFGAGSVKGVFVEDQSDEYVPRGTGEDAGLHVCALRVRIFST